MHGNVRTRMNRGRAAGGRTSRGRRSAGTGTTAAGERGRTGRQDGRTPGNRFGEQMKSLSRSVEPTARRQGTNEEAGWSLESLEIDR